MRFLGQFETKLDDKNRIAIPSKYRGHFGSDAVYLTTSPDPCIVAHTKASFDEKSARVEALEDETEEARAAARTYFGNTAEITPDGQGRMVLPAHLLDHAGLKGPTDVLLIGAGKYFEIWAPGALPGRGATAGKEG